MLKKLKTKFNRKFASKIALFVFILSSFLGFIPTAKAADYPISNITITTDTLTKTKSGIALGNLVRVGKNDPITFTVRLTLTSPATGITLRTDKVDYDLGPNQPFPIIEFGAGAEKVNGNTCQQRFVTSANIQGFIPFVGSENKTYMYCSFTGGTRQIATKVDSNKAYDLTFSTTAAALGLDTSKRNSAQSFAVYPYLRMELWGPNTNSVFQNASKEIFVEFFETTAEAQAAIDQGKQAPSGVPNYGANTGSGVTNETGGALLDLLNRIIGFLLGLIQEFIYAVFFWLIAPLIQAMLSVHPYQDTFVAVIYPGWEVVRNLCNIFFILALIIIAMATLFRVDSYKFKDLIVQLIIAALLVNFSLVIAQIILGLADTIQAQFLPANVTVIRSLAADLMVTNWRGAVLQSGFGSQGTFAATVQPLFYLALSLGSFGVFCAICVFLVVRVVMLWLLLMISPLAYAVGILPATAKYRGEWWGNFLKYAFFTPIMAFFLNMAAIISNTSKENPVLQEINGLAAASSLGDSSIASFVLKVGSNLLLLVFLIAALKVAEAAGIYGASGITEIAKKGIFAPFAAAGFGAKAAGGYVGRKWNEFTANKIRGDARKVSGIRGAAYAVLNPVAFGKAWAKESERKKHSAQEKAEMAGLEVVQQRFDSPKAFFKGSYKIEPHVLQHEKHHEDEKAKNLQNMSRENVAQTAAEYFLLGDDEDSKAYKRGVIKLAMSKGYIDDIVEEAYKTKEGREMIKQMEKVADKPLVKGQDYEEVNLTELDDHGHERVVMGADGRPVKTKKMLYNHITRRAMYKAMFGVDSHGHLKDHAAMRLITEEGEKEGMDTGHLEYMTDMYFNNKTGNYEFYKLKEVKDSQGNITGYTSAGDQQMAGAEIAKRNSRTQAGIAWHSLMSSSGKTLYEDVFAKIAKAIAENPPFMQERTANMLVAGKTMEEDKIDKDGNVVEEGLQTIRNRFIQKGILEVDEVSAQRLQAISKLDQRAFVSIISRFVNDASPGAIETRTMEGFKIQYKDKTGTTKDLPFDLSQAKKVLEDRADAVDRAKEAAAKRKADKKTT